MEAVVPRQSQDRPITEGYTVISGPAVMIVATLIQQQCGNEAVAEELVKDAFLRSYL